MMLTILTYHSLDTSGSVVSVGPEQFADQMACVAAQGYRGLSLREALAYRETHADWPADGVVLTFDDGYANFYEAALPVLQQHGFTATVFLVNGYVARDNGWAPPPPRLGTRPLLSWNQVAALAAAGMEIGSHTRSHPDLRHLSRQQVEDEIVGARVELERRLGTTVESFAYPFGYLSEESQDLVQREFRAACTTVLKRVHDEPLYLLPRVDMYYIRSRQQLQRLMQGRLDRYLAFRRWGRSIRHRLPSTG